MNTKTAAASVIGARHQRAGRNGQDAASVWTGAGVTVAVVCDGCSSGVSSEVGARLGAMLFARTIGEKLAAGACVRERPVWEETRAQVGRTLGASMSTSTSTSAIEQAIHDHLLFTIVAAAITSDGAAVWALGDGAYAHDGITQVLGPFPDNSPPYLAYDLLDNPQPAHFATFEATRIVVATDGIDDLELDFAMFAAPALMRPDALRRKLVQLARSEERIDWHDERVIRTPARLQDDLAIAVIEVTDA